MLAKSNLICNFNLQMQLMITHQNSMIKNKKCKKGTTQNIKKKIKKILTSLEAKTSCFFQGIMTTKKQ